MIDKLNCKFTVRDEDGYTDAEVIKKVNEIIEVLNKVLEQLKEQNK